MSGRPGPVLFAVTDAITADAFLRPHLAASAGSGRATYLMAGPSPRLQRVAAEVGAVAVPVPMRRNPAPWRDLRALVTAVVRIRALRPAAVHVGTPKAGLVVGLAARIARVPTRVYVLHGLRYESARGWSRRLLMAAEWIACRAATAVVAVSPSVRAEAIRAGVCPPGRIQVLGHGSISGVDAARFDRDDARRRAFREQHGVAPDVPVLLFVGRLSRDKGVGELAEAWRLVSARHPAAWLVVVGAPDPDSPADDAVLRALAGDSRVVLTGALPDPASAFSAADLLVLPSHREGFATVVMEAAAAGIPAVASDVTGCRDSVCADETGLLVPPRDAAALADAIGDLLEAPDRAAAMGRRARARAVADFAPDRVVGRYAELLV